MSIIKNLSLLAGTGISKSKSINQNEYNLMKVEQSNNYNSIWNPRYIIIRCNMWRQTAVV